MKTGSMLAWNPFSLSVCVLDAHDFVDVVLRFGGDAVEPACTTCAYSIIDVATTRIVSGEGFGIIAIILNGIGGHKTCGTAQSLYRVVGVDTQACGGPWLKLRNTYCTSR